MDVDSVGIKASDYKRVTGTGPEGPAPATIRRRRTAALLHPNLAPENGPAAVPADESEGERMGPPRDARHHDPEPGARRVRVVRVDRRNVGARATEDGRRAGPELARDQDL